MAADGRRDSGSLRLVLGATLVTLAVGYLVKLPCLTGAWTDGRQYTRLCYSDVAALYAARGLDRGDLPYLEADNEYPVLTGVAMATAAAPARSYVSFFNWTAAMLAAGALATAWALHRLVGGRRAMLFAAAPTLAAYGFMNWDLLAVALSTLGTLALLRGREIGAGALLGLGAAAKLYPALLVPVFALDRLRRRRPAAAARLIGAAAAAWLAVNLPVALLAPERWSLFYRFSAERQADWDSMWLLAERHLDAAFATETLNLLVAGSFAFLALLVAGLAAARRGGLPAWTLAFPVLVVFLLSGKVYSPQFSLWLLPWFALALPDLRLFVAFQVTDVAVFVTRFQYFGELQLGRGLPLPAFEAALVARAAVLAACVGVWLWRESRRPEARGVLEGSAA